MNHKKTIKYITVILCVLFILQCSSQSYATINFSSSNEAFFNFNSNFVNGSVFEWKIQNVKKSSNFEEIQLNNNDILSIELTVDMAGKYNITNSILYYLYGELELPYTILINGEELGWYEGYNYLSRWGPARYQYAFGLAWIGSLNRYEPVYLYPLEYVNGSETVPYFDKFYDTLYEIATELENWEVTKNRNEKIIEMKYSFSDIQLDYEETSEKVQSINTEVGILRFFKYNYNYIDKLNSSNSEYFAYEISSTTYQAGYENIDFILIISLSILCMTYLVKRRKPS